MKCRYCGSNLGFEDEYCPYCGKLNDQAAGHQAVMKEYRNEYENTVADVKVKSRKAGRTGRLIVIGLMLAAIGLMLISIRINSDFERIDQKENERIVREVDNNLDGVTAKLDEMEKNRDYLALNNYNLNYRLRSDSRFDDYSRVFTAVISYGVIHDDILNILSGFEGYDEKTAKDWCYDAAIYISDWNSFVGGEFWSDAADSPMHAGEHGAFLADIKKDTQDMVQVYFDLTDEQASAIWEMDRDTLGEMLYENCIRLYPEGETGEPSAE